MLDKRDNLLKLDSKTYGHLKHKLIKKSCVAQHAPESNHAIHKGNLKLIKNVCKMRQLNVFEYLCSVVVIFTSITTKTYPENSNKTT